VDSAVHELYLEGRYHLNQTSPSEIIKAIALLEEAIGKDPLYAPAHAALANCYVYLGWLGAVAGEVYPKAKQAAVRALEIDETLAEPHSVLGYAATYYYWSWEEAERELERAIELNPNSAQAHLHYSWYLCSQDRLTESRTAILRAKELDPFSIIIHANLANYFHMRRDYDGALVQTRKALELEPDAPIVLLFHGMACWGKELYEEATAGFKKLVDLTGGGPGFKGYLAYSYAKVGLHEKVLAILDELTVLSNTQPVPSFQFALVFLGMGRNDEALIWLEQAFDERAGAWFPHIRHEGLFDPLRGYPRFREIVRRLNFPEL
jgi:tetratricopeptide (TPR) repeat protein